MYSYQKEKLVSLDPTSNAARVLFKIKSLLETSERVKRYLVSKNKLNNTLIYFNVIIDKYSFLRNVVFNFRREISRLGLSILIDARQDGGKKSTLQVIGEALILFEVGLLWFKATPLSNKVASQPLWSRPLSLFAYLLWLISGSNYGKFIYTIASFFKTPH